MAAGVAIAPAGAQASPAGRTEATVGHPVTTSRAIALPASACAALRHSLHSKSASCAAQERFRLVRLRHAPGGTGRTPVSSAAANYYEGYGSVCGGSFGGPCQSWWVDLHVAFTVSGSQAWVNAWSPGNCTQGGTTITWCSYTGNGTSVLSMGANFGANGYVRYDVFANHANCNGMVLPLGCSSLFYPWDGTWGADFSSWANSSNSSWCNAPSSGCYG